MPGLEQRQGNSEGFGVLWIQAVGSLIAVAVGVVTVKSAGLSPIWVTLLLGLAVLLILGAAAPTLLRALLRAWKEMRLALRLRTMWPAFRREVDERRWLYARMHAHSLNTLLSALHSAPAEEEARVRVRILQSAGSYCARLDDIRMSLDGLVEARWPGVARAKAVIRLFELLIGIPDAAGWLRELTATDRMSLDWKVVDEWASRYRHSLELYSRWARDRNRELGDRVFREHIL